MKKLSHLRVIMNHTLPRGGCYENAVYSAQAQLRFEDSSLLQAEITLKGPSAWYVPGNDAITGYQLYANNMPVYTTSTSNLIAASSAWYCSFTLSCTLPAETAVIGLCPIRPSGQRAEETILIALSQR